ncbi:MAG: hypothetical protein WBZ37_03955 [Mycobacterium sp.]
MTAPPGGPFGPDPSGPNPYGQEPYWGSQPQGGPYSYPPSGPYSYPPSGPYSYPPGGPYPNPQGGTDPSGPYPPQQFPPNWPGGPYPPGPPPGGRRSKAPWLIVAGIALVGVIAVAAIVVVSLTKDNKSPNANPSGPPSATTSAPTSQPSSSEQDATDCTPNVSGGEKPPGNTIEAGKLSFLATAAPGWTVFSDDQNPNLIGALGVSQTVPGANQWAMSAEVAVTNFVASMDVSAQASKLIQCVATGPGYANASPTLGPTKTSSTTVDGIKAARVDADIAIADTSKGVKGDSVVIIAVDTKPVTVFLGGTPIGDAASAATINQVIAALKVTKS